MDESFRKIFGEASSIQLVADSLLAKTPDLSALGLTKTIAERLLAEQRQIADLRQSVLGDHGYPLHHWFHQNNALREMVSGRLDRPNALRILGDQFGVSNADFKEPMLKDSQQWLKHQSNFDDILKRFTGHDIFDVFSSNVIGQDIARLCELNGGAHRALAALSDLGRYHDLLREYEALTASVREVTLPEFDYDFSGRLGAMFSVRDLLNFSRSDDAQRYLQHTDLPSDFMAASPALIGAACMDLGVLARLPQRTVRRTNNRQLKKTRASRSLHELQVLLAWFESALRERVDQVMTERNGSDWARTTRSKTVAGWVKLYDKKQQSVWHASFRPARVVDASHFSELMEFALLSEECSAHILSFGPIPEQEIKVEIGRVNDARNGLAHRSARADEHVFGFVHGIIVKLASLAGLITPGTDSIDFDASDE